MHKKQFTSRYFERGGKMFEVITRTGEKPKVKVPVRLSRGELKSLEDQFMNQNPERERSVRIIAKNLTAGPRKITERDVEAGLRLLFERQYERGYREGELAATQQRIADEIHGASLRSAGTRPTPPAAPMRLPVKKVA